MYNGICPRCDGDTEFLFDKDKGDSKIANFECGDCGLKFYELWSCTIYKVNEDGSEEEYKGE